MTALLAFHLGLPESYHDGALETSVVRHYDCIKRSEIGW